ncbi:MAG: GNAT family N-acetyltransferase [Arhodomonas sp.]|nr:GNAT family N-acetyltransferase [Arhodomonas sp.]
MPWTAAITHSSVTSSSPPSRSTARWGTPLVGRRTTWCCATPPGSSPLPAYLKDHSSGEFVFDFAWADAHARHGLDYYPKLVVAIPWTPATGPRVLTRPGVDASRLERLLLEAAREHADATGLSSVHWLFLPEAATAGGAEAGYLHRLGCQFHWHNRSYPDFAAFLADLTAKKRKNIRRERRLVEQAGIRLRVLHGDEADAALCADLHRFYRNTFRERGNVPVLSRECFRALGERLRRRMVLFVAERGDRPVAGAICFRDAGTLYGRYWGGDEAIDCLHFETCYYQGIEYCIREGLQRFEPGAQGEHKVPRGFLPVLTHSLHHLREPAFHRAVADFLARERPAVKAYAEELTMAGPYRQQPASPS